MTGSKPAYKQGEVVLVNFVFGDHPVMDWQEAGLLYPSAVTGIIRTVKQTMIDHRLGRLTSEDYQAVEQNLRQVLGL